MNRIGRPSLVWLVIALISVRALPTHGDETAESQNAADAHAAFEKHVFALPKGGTMTVHRRSGTGPTLVLVPGTWGDLRSFAALIAHLSDDLSIVVIELCWQGGQVPPTLDLSIEQLADDVLWTISMLQLDQFIISGHSIGGMIAVEICGRDVPGLIGGIPMEGWSDYSVVQTAFNGTVVGKLTAAQEAQREADRARGRRHLSVEQCAAIATIWRRWNGTDCLERSRVPILHVWGDRNLPRPSRTALQIPDRPSIEVAWIAGASHALVLEAPDLLAESMRDFIRRTTTP